MVVTFVHHSCFTIETETKMFIFDYFPKMDLHGYVFTGKEPVLPKDKRVYVFASHSHQDHFSLEVLRWAEQTENIQYIFSKDIRLGNNYLVRNGIDPKVKQKITFVKPCASYRVDDLEITTLRSTDAGVAYLVKADGETFYHAGDLNQWKWDGVGELINGKESRAYHHEIKKLSDIHIDVAFVVLDTRLKQNATLGLDYFMQNIEADVVFPMHMWQDYSYVPRYKRKISNGAFAARLVEVQGENEVYDL